jgi:hypothetical protein
MVAVDFSGMADLANFNLKTKGREARLRALLEDVTEHHAGIYPQNRLALAVWFGKSLESQDQHLLELFSGLPGEGIADTRFSLLWKTGSEGPPFVSIDATSVGYFSRLLSLHPEAVALYREKYEVLYSDKSLLTEEILDAFRIITAPPGLIRGWYISEVEYTNAIHAQNLLALHRNSRPEIGLVKIEESADFENCRGLLHVEINQKWLPLSPEGIRDYTYYRDYQNGRRAFFLFEGGSVYQVLKFEVKTNPEYSSRLVGKTPNDRYPEVYLRAVHQLAPSAA